MLLMVERGIRGKLCRHSNRYAKANNKHMGYYDKSKKSSYLQYWDENNWYGWIFNTTSYLNTKIFSKQT